MWPFSDQEIPTISLEEAGVQGYPTAPLDAYTYDYIIIGGGTAGSVLAARLTEDPNVSVLVLERGGLANGWMDRVPLISSNPYREGAPVGRWWTRPVLPTEDRAMEVVCGEALGGTSAVNCMFYTRGPAGDYNRWKELGNPGWGYEDLEPYFAKSESAPRIHGTHRALRCSVIRAAQNAGIPYAEDLSAPSTPAAAYVRHDISQDSSMRRHTPFHVFLSPKVVQACRQRLKICPHALVTRIEVAAPSGDSEIPAQAVGVHFEAANFRQAGKSFYAHARREVVLCAGALASPQILMLSGIGPKAHLEEKGIWVRRDLPGVGSYLKDHVAVPLTFEAPMKDSLHELETSPMKVVKELATYLCTGRGIFSYPFQAVTLYVASCLLDDKSHISVPVGSNADALNTRVPANCPDLEIMPAANNCTDHDIPRTGVFTLMAAHIRPKSHGSVRLATRNPRTRPDVELGFFSDPADMPTLVKGLRLAMRLAEDMRGQGYPLKGLIVPETLDYDALDAFARKNMRTCYHYTSTCRMGAEDDVEHPGVVDAKLRVHGVRGLRVCDASVFPEIVGAHTMAPVVAVAERCADLMKESARQA
ncbi:GMC oxidoreductase [Trametes versicolor FP-101664 SS1]|uniref:GMC oxidoreductase n=1 Tax=Trametes versicolor (strain FP-101664) TaxID=717944 RepID=UPI0004623AAF|nr:GMC oxidoreductase [Trametes versicolor FP-101664 SS1]EIW54978.1 GMC oxidoreductase [Trametes versicolor FP-101664 SS1]